MSDDGVLQVGDWHHLKVSVHLADAATNESIFYRIVADKDTWALSLHTSGTSSIVGIFIIGFGRLPRKGPPRFPTDVV